MDTQNKFKGSGLGLDSVHSTVSTPFGLAHLCLTTSLRGIIITPTWQIRKMRYSLPSITQLVNDRAGQNPGQAEAHTQLPLSSSGKEERW